MSSTHQGAARAVGHTGPWLARPVEGSLDPRPGTPLRLWADNVENSFLHPLVTHRLTSPREMHIRVHSPTHVFPRSSGRPGSAPDPPHGAEANPAGPTGVQRRCAAAGVCACGRAGLSLGVGIRGSRRGAAGRGQSRSPAAGPQGDGRGQPAHRSASRSPVHPRAPGAPRGSSCLSASDRRLASPAARAPRRAALSSPPPLGSDSVLSPLPPLSLFSHGAGGAPPPARQSRCNNPGARGGATAGKPPARGRDRSRVPTCTPPSCGPSRGPGTSRSDSG